MSGESFKDLKKYLLNEAKDVPKEQILKTIEARFTSRKIYTRVGTTIVSVNPGFPIEQYDEATFARFSPFKLESFSPRPHIFAVGRKIFRSIIGFQSPRKHCAVVTHGVSGSGKTESIRMIVRYLARASTQARRSNLDMTLGDTQGLNNERVVCMYNYQGQNQRDLSLKKGDIIQVLKRTSASGWWYGRKGEKAGLFPSNYTKALPSEPIDTSRPASLEEKLIFAIPCLEAFLHAKTAHNFNSSRSGVVMIPGFDTSGRIISAAVAIYMMEKQRITRQAAQSRNFHIFYGLCAHVQTTGDSKEKEIFNPKSLKCLNDDGTLNMKKEKDFFDRTIQHLERMGIKDTKDIQNILKGILCLGNVEFETSRKSEMSQRTRGYVEAGAYYLGIDEKILEEEIIGPRTPRTKTPGNAVNFVKTVMSEAYAMLSRWIVNTFNKHLAGVCKDNRAKFVVLVDLPGFDFVGGTRNTIEHFSINYASEVLQTVYEDSCLVLLGQAYRDDEMELQVEGLEESTARRAVETSSKLFTILEDGAKSSASDTDLADHVSKFRGELTGSLTKMFTVAHYMGEVAYSTEGFSGCYASVPVQRARDLLGRSNIPILRSLLARSEPTAVPKILQTISRFAPKKSEVAGIVTSQKKPEKKIRRQIKPLLSPAMIAGTRRERSAYDVRELFDASEFTHSGLLQRKNLLTTLSDTLQRVEVSWVACVKPSATGDKFDGKEVSKQLKFTKIDAVAELASKAFAEFESLVSFANQYGALLPDDYESKGPINDAKAIIKTVNENLKGGMPPFAHHKIGKQNLFYNHTFKTCLEFMRIEHIFIPSSVRAAAYVKAFTLRNRLRVIIRTFAHLAKIMMPAKSKIAKPPHKHHGLKIDLAFTTGLQILLFEEKEELLAAIEYGKENEMLNMAHVSERMRLYDHLSLLVDNMARLEKALLGEENDEEDDVVNSTNIPPTTLGSKILELDTTVLFEKKIQEVPANTKLAKHRQTLAHCCDEVVAALQGLASKLPRALELDCADPLPKFPTRVERLVVSCQDKLSKLHPSLFSINDMSDIASIVLASRAVTQKERSMQILIQSDNSDPILLQQIMSEAKALSKPHNGPTLELAAKRVSELANKQQSDQLVACFLEINQNFLSIVEGSVKSESSTPSRTSMVSMGSSLSEGSIIADHEYKRLAASLVRGMERINNKAFTSVKNIMFSLEKLSNAGISIPPYVRDLEKLAKKSRDTVAKLYMAQKDLHNLIWSAKQGESTDLSIIPDCSEHVDGAGEIFKEIITHLHESGHNVENGFEAWKTQVFQALVISEAKRTLAKKRDSLPPPPPETDGEDDDMEGEEAKIDTFTCSGSRDSSLPIIEETDNRKDSNLKRPRISLSKFPSAAEDKNGFKSIYHNQINDLQTDLEENHGCFESGLTDPALLLQTLIMRQLQSMKDISHLIRVAASAFSIHDTMASSQQINMLEDLKGLVSNSGKQDTMQGAIPDISLVKRVQCILMIKEDARLVKEAEEVRLATIPKTPKEMFPKRSSHGYDICTEESLTLRKFATINSSTSRLNRRTVNIPWEFEPKLLSSPLLRVQAPSPHSPPGPLAPPPVSRSPSPSKAFLPPSSTITSAPSSPVPITRKRHNTCVSVSSAPDISPAENLEFFSENSENAPHAGFGVLRERSTRPRRAALSQAMDEREGGEEKEGSPERSTKSAQSKSTTSQNKLGNATTSLSSVFGLESDTIEFMILKEGPLLKRGETNKKYRSRFFRLVRKKNDYLLKYWEKVKDKEKIKGSILLSTKGVSVSSPDDLIQSDAKEFEVKVPYRVFHLRADTPGEAVDWCRNIKTVLDQFAPKSFVEGLQHLETCEQMLDFVRAKHGTLVTTDEKTPKSGMDHHDDDEETPPKDYGFSSPVYKLEALSKAGLDAKTTHPYDVFDLPPTAQIVLLQGDLKDPEKIRAATLEVYVERLTAKGIDERAADMLLTNYTLSAKPMDLLLALMRRYCIPDPFNLCDEELVQHRENARIIKLAVLTFINIWVREYFVDFEKDEDLGKILTEFLDAVQGNDKMPEAREIAEMNLHHFHNPEPNGPELYKIEDLTADDAVKEKKFDKIKARVFAEQITLLHFAIYQSIRTREFLKTGWSKPDKAKRSPYIVRMTEHFVFLSHYVIETIVEEPDLKKRVTLYIKWLEIGQFCFEMQNYHATGAIFAGLSGAAVWRMKRTRALVGKKMKIYETLKTITKRDGNSREYRALLEKAFSSCVPYLPTFCGDLEKTETANESSILGMINFFKHQQRMGTIIKVLRFQKQQYNYEKIDIHPGVQQMFKQVLISVPSEREFEDRVWKQSLESEPRLQEQEHH